LGERKERDGREDTLISMILLKAVAVDTTKVIHHVRQH